MRRPDFICEMLLRPKSMIGQGIEYTIGDTSITITNVNSADSARRRIEIPINMLGRFISELQEIEKICES